MHHVALDRAGPDDRHLDHQVVECPRLQPRQHRHLRAASRSGTRRSCPPCGSSRRCRDLPAARSPRSSRSPRCSARRSKARRMQPSMPRPSTSTFIQRRMSMSSLSHSMTWRSCIAAGSIGTSSSSRSRVSTNPPGCCDRCRGNPISSWASSSVRRSRRSCRFEVEFFRAFFADAVFRPSPELRGERAGHVLGQPHRPCRPRGRHHARDSGSPWRRSRPYRGRIAHRSTG